MLAVPDRRRDRRDRRRSRVVACDGADLRASH
jgi:hypothetical protein